MSEYKEHLIISPLSFITAPRTDASCVCVYGCVFGGRDEAERKNSIKVKVNGVPSTRTFTLKTIIYMRIDFPVGMSRRPGL